MDVQKKSVLTMAGIAAVLAVMVGITSYSVTLYRLFCQVTGANGTTQRAATASTTQTAREVTVFFDTSVAPNLPWRFAPMQRSVKLHLGQDALVFFSAENLSDRDIVGHATFNVSPEKAGLYFTKVQCFCFNEERLAAHQRVEMPVDFYVDPKMGTDPNTEDVHEITLSYTFFQSKNPDTAIELSRFSAASADPAAGLRLFAQDCASCHAPDRALIGPALAGVVGRRAGTAPGYAYSAALREWGQIWTAEKLERWLARPQAVVPGTKMPAMVPAEAERRDIVAYLATLAKAPGSGS